jgi:hypothetical protein
MQYQTANIMPNPERHIPVLKPGYINRPFRPDAAKCCLLLMLLATDC